MLALLFDALIGDPDWLWRHLPHPVVLMGRLIAGLDHRFNDVTKSDLKRRLAGILAVILCAAIAAGIGLCLETLLETTPYGSVLVAVLASIFLAQRSLYQHIRQVQTGFTRGGIEAARHAVARVVGRDPEALDEAAICRAAIESCAENFSDGVVAPAFWFALFGVPGLMVYKIVNTADSMIGHRTQRHEAFGWAAARLDDLMNLGPARLAGCLLCLTAPVSRGRVGPALTTMWRDARLHRSPNAGWPESAMAGGLGIMLGGPRFYGGKRVDDPFLNPQGRAARPADISRGLNLLLAACGLEILLAVGLAYLI